MLIWSIVPSQTIWQSSDEEQRSQTKVTEVKGVKVLVETLADGKGRVCQVMSTNPADFLREDLTPGTIVNLV